MNRLLTSKRSNVLKSALGQASRRKCNVLRSRMHPMLSSARPNAYEFVPQQRQSEVTSWQPRENIDIQRVTQQAMIHELTMQQNSKIAEIVPWFLEQMPSSYFNSVPEDFRLDHIKAITAIENANMDLHMNLKSILPDGRLVLTYIRPGKTKLLSLVKHLPWNFNSDDYLPISRAQVFTSEDGKLSISMFVFGDEKTVAHILPVEVAGGKILELANEIQNEHYIGDSSFPKPSHLFERDSLLRYLENCPESYIVRSDPRRFLKQMQLYKKVTGSECMDISVERSQNEDAVGDFWVDVAVANSLPQIALENATMVLSEHNLDIVRSHLDMLSDGANGNICMLRLLVSPTDEAGPRSLESFKPIVEEMKRTKWLDPTTMNLVFEKFPWLGIKRGEIITAMCSILHPLMSSKNPFAFSRNHIYDLVTKKRYIRISAEIADLFLDRFHPTNNLSDDDFLNRKEIIVKDVEENVEDTIAKDLFMKMIDIVEHTLKTNIYLENRYALGIRLDSKAIQHEYSSREEEPFGIIFCHGRRFNAFHVRFKDVARGGMRLVTPNSPEQFALESARQYDECYGLAYAQQLKNKDIPEGGSKAVNLIDCNGLSAEAKQFVMRKSVKAFTNTILDLIVDTEETRDLIVDRHGQNEVIYLGPDEQVTVDDINWIVDRAAKRGYKTPNAFMSSKPKAGINHKQYGVTSEGVNTYLEVSLQKVLGINPKCEPFTIKLTGGPDGDVAGNEILILDREYGDNAIIVGIADGSGCAEDPEGLDHQELIRLVKSTLPICEFNPKKLNANGKIFHANNEEGIKARNSMHNRLVTDVFVPAGGRPSTIDIRNYKNFLLPDGTGTPSSKLIIEGANLFITSDARKALYEEAGVHIVKDSSANKTGVITSSYEICSAMLLSDEEFFENKSKIVDQILGKLRGLARMEAELLFREYDREADALPNISQRVSSAINLATDAIIKELSDLSPEEEREFLQLFKNHLPQIIAELAFDRVYDRMPPQYIKNAIASCLASKLVYKEGCQFINKLSTEKLGRIALDYVSKEKDMALLEEAVKGSNVGEEEKAKILEIIATGGIRSALKL